MPCNLVKCTEILRENQKRHISTMLHGITPQKAVIYCIQKKLTANLHSRNVRLDIIKVFTPTDAQVFFKGVLIHIKTAPQHVSV